MHSTATCQLSGKGRIGTTTASFDVAVGETVTCVFSNCADSYSKFHLSGVVVSGTEIFEACDALTADNFEVAGTGDATFRAGNKITLENGFRLQWAECSPPGSTD